MYLDIPVDTNFRPVARMFDGDTGHLPLKLIVVIAGRSCFSERSVFKSVE